jgi:TetR/AcrR family transcriptional regulator
MGVSKGQGWEASRVDGPVTTRRIGATDSATRGALVDAAEQLLLQEGYAAVTSRRIAAKAGLKPQLVHYYFATMDDLFLALVERGWERSEQRQAAALAGDRPLAALWEVVGHPTGARLIMELSSLANHRPRIRAGLQAVAERVRRSQVDGVARVLARGGIQTEVAGLALSAEALVVLMMGVAQFLAMEEQTVGITTGHAEVRDLVVQLIAGLPGPKGATGSEGGIRSHSDTDKGLREKGSSQ